MPATETATAPETQEIQDENLGRFATDDDVAKLDALLSADEADQSVKDSKAAEELAQKPDEAPQAGQPVSEEAAAAPETPAGEGKAGTPEAPKTEPEPEKGKADDGKGKTPYQNAKARERDRLEDGWKKFNAEKEQHRAEIARKEAELTRRQQEIEAKQRENQFTAADWEAAAEEWEKEGKFDMAEAAKEYAKQAREQERNAPPVARTETPQFRETRNQAWAETKKQFPEITDKASPLNVKVREFISQNPDIMQLPSAPYLVAKHMKAVLDASVVPELQSTLKTKTAEIEQLQARVKELERLTNPGVPSGATAIPGQRSFDDLPIADQEAQLKRDLAGMPV